MRRQIRKNSLVTLLVALSFLLNGCVIQRGTEELEKVEYTVVKPGDIPQSLSEKIETEKAACFELVYSDNAYMYVVRGYGEQETGGYCIQVEDCYLMDHVICVKTSLVGPQVGEPVNKEPSYPYIVLKMELREEKVKFL